MEFHGTTICAVKKDGVTAIAGDGQVTMGESVIFKNTAIKVRRIYLIEPRSILKSDNSCLIKAIFSSLFIIVPITSVYRLSLLPPFAKGRC